MPKPPPPPVPSAKPPKPTAVIDPFARALAATVREAHGVDQASTLDMSEEIGSPRGYVGTRNIALDRALGTVGIPLGRVTEISGWPGAGKSTILDQILTQCQEEGGIGVLANTEHTRNRAYMAALGCRPESLVWIAGSTIELMFDELETIAKRIADMNVTAWVGALNRAGVKCPAPPTYAHEVYDPNDSSPQRKPVARFSFAKWGREQAAALMEWQAQAKLPVTSVRDAASRAKLRPCIYYGEPDGAKAAYAAYAGDGAHPDVQPADRPVVIGWDSVAGTPTEEELAGDARDQHVATAAKVIRRNLRRLVQVIDNEAIAFVLVNQRYERISTGRTFLRGPASETYGGGGIKYHTTLRIEVDKVGDILPMGGKFGETPPMGQIVRIKVPKNKINDPFREEQFGLIFGRGAENAWALYEDLKERGIIRAGGGWSGFSDPSILGDHDRKFRGWTDLSNMLAEDSTLWSRLCVLYMEGRL